MGFGQRLGFVGVVFGCGIRFHDVSFRRGWILSYGGFGKDQSGFVAMGFDRDWWGFCRESESLLQWASSRNQGLKQKLLEIAVVDVGDRS